MELIKRKIEEYSSVEVGFSTGKLQCVKSQRELLVIHFRSNNDVNHDDLRLMNAMKLAAINLWCAEVIILDLKNLHYKWGDTMEFLFQSPHTSFTSPIQTIFASQQDKQIPIVAICSNHNRKGLTSLVRDEMGKDPSQILFESLDEAVAALEVEL